MGAGLALVDDRIAVPRRAWLPARLVEVLEAFEAGGESVDFERELAGYLGATQVLCVWMDWPRRVAWSPAGVVSPRLQELVPEVAGSGRRTVLPNAILEPIGAAPARGVLVVKGAADQVLQAHVLRLISRIAARLGHREGPSLDRLIQH